MDVMEMGSPLLIDDHMHIKELYHTRKKLPMNAADEKLQRFRHHSSGNLFLVINTRRKRTYSTS